MGLHQKFFGDQIQKSRNAEGEHRVKCRGSQTRKQGRTYACARKQ